MWFAAWGEVRQLSEGGSELVLARRNERDRLIAESERAAQAEREAAPACESGLEEVRAAEAARVSAEAGAARGRATQGRGAGERRGAPSG